MNQTEQTNSQFSRHRQGLRGEGRKTSEDTKGAEFRATQQRQMKEK